MSDGFWGKSVSDRMTVSGRLVTVFGGSGFIGRHVVRALARDGWRIRVACRRPDLAGHLQPLGKVGQIMPVQANVRYPDSLAMALRGADAAVNLVGILAPTGRQTFEGVQAFGAGAVARAVRDAGIDSFVHMSALGADAASPSAYGRSKADGEAQVRLACPAATILRPSIVFGPEDDFFNRFAAMARILPILPLIGADTLFQPVFVGDVADAVSKAVAGDVMPATTYELGGPDRLSFRALVQFVCKSTGRKRLLVALPFGPGRLMAQATEIVSAVSLGLFPSMLTTTRDQVEMLRADNVVSPAAEAEHRTFEGLGLQPEAFAAIVPSYLYRFRKTGQFERNLA